MIHWFIVMESNTGGENKFSIGSISSDPSKNSYQKHRAYFSLYHGRFSKKDILIQHKYLCEKNIELIMTQLQFLNK